MSTMNLTRRQLFAAGLGLGGAFALAACSPASSDPAPSAEPEDVTVRVASLKGPTTIGLVSMMDQTSGIPEADSSQDDEKSDSSAGDGVSYQYAISASPDEVLPQVISGSVDIALVPSNAAAVLYNKTKGGVQTIDVNTLGVLSVVTGDASVTDFEALAGKTVYVSGKGASPEYTLNYLLGKAGISDKVGVEWKSEHEEVAAVLATDANAVGILPEPFATATIAKNPVVSSVVSLTDVWKRYVDDGSQFVMGVTVVRSDFAKDHPEVVRDFLQRHAASVDAVNDDPEAAAKLVVKAGIVAKEPIAKKAIPGCNVVCLTGTQMKDALEGYLQVLSDADPTSVGGHMPADDFYYLGE